MVATIYGKFSSFRTLLVLFSLGASDTKTLPQHEEPNRYLETIILQEDFDNLQSPCSGQAGNYERDDGNGWIASDPDFYGDKGDVQEERKKKFKNLVLKVMAKTDLMYKQLSKFDDDDANRIGNLYPSQVGDGGNIVHRLSEDDEEDNSEQNLDIFKELIKELYDKRDFKMLKNLIFGDKDGDSHDRVANSDDNQRERLYFEEDDTSKDEQFEGAQEEEIERIVKEILGTQGNEDHTLRRANEEEIVWMVPMDKK